MTETLSSLHNPYMDKIRDDAHGFVTGLGMQPIPKDRMAVVLPDQGQQIRDRFKKGPNVRAGYGRNSKEVFVIAGQGVGTAAEVQAQDTSLGAHELAHSASDVPGEHAFYGESLAGLVESDYLASRASEFTPRPDAGFTSEGQRLILPGEFRYFGNSERTNSTQAMIGAHGLSLALENADIHRRDLYERAALGNSGVYDLMRYTLTQLDPTLPQRIEGLPSTTKGVLAASALIQVAARNR